MGPLNGAHFRQALSIRRWMLLAQVGLFFNPESKKNSSGNVKIIEC